MRQTILWFALLTLITKLSATRNEIARDYFVYKNVPSVVAFSCENETIDNFYLKKRLNEDGISVAILYPEFKFSLQTVLAVKYSRFGVFLDSLHCPNWYSDFILAESSKFGAYTELYSWLVIGKSLNESIRMLNDEAFSIGTDLVIATAKNNEHYNFHDVYNHGKERRGKLNVTEFASWKKESGLNVTLVQEKYQRRGNFNGMKLKMMSVTQYRPDDIPVKDYLQDYSTKPLDSMSKFVYAILSHISDIFNFTMEVEETSLWEQVDGEGVHHGMLGMLHRRKTDLAASPAIMTKERSILTQLIGPIWPFRSCFMFRSIPTSISDQFIRPFTTESWKVTGVVILICVIVLGLNLKIEFLKYRSNSWNEAVLITTSIMCQQGTTIAPKFLSSRIVIIHLLLFSLLIYNYYSASIVSAQLNLPLNKMNDSLHELTKSHLEVAAEPITYTNYGLTALCQDWEVKEFYVKRWTRLTDDERYMSLEEGFARVAKGGFAYHADPNTAYPYLEKLFSDQMICELTEIHLFKPQKMALFGKRNSPFTKMIKIGLAKLLTSGILNREEKRWASRKPVCFREAFAIQSVSILTTAPAFIILCVGIISASLICIIENVIAKCVRKLKKTNIFNR